MFEEKKKIVRTQLVSDLSKWGHYSTGGVYVLKEDQRGLSRYTFCSSMCLAAWLHHGLSFCDADAEFHDVEDVEETPELEARGPRQARDVMDQLPVNDYVSVSLRFITKRHVRLRLSQRVMLSFLV